MEQKWILGVQITDRLRKTSDVQDLLTKFGCSIRTRLGLHDINGDECSPTGLILLELTGNPEEFGKLERELMKLEGVNVRKMVFEK